jgi:Ulp1 family protease
MSPWHYHLYVTKVQNGVYKREDPDAVCPVVPSLAYREHRLLAFITIQDFHYTLAIAVNTKWTKDLSQTASAASWWLLHFDSLGDHSTTRNNAVDFAALVMALPRQSFKIKEVPVPQQDNYVDCGLCALHFLRVFLQDIDAAVRHCTKVCDSL